MSVEVKRLTNANVYLNGKSYLGKAAEAKLPDVVATLTEHAALGMVGKLELPSGLDKMEMTIKWNSLYPDVMIAAGNPFQGVQLQLRGSQETYAGAGRIKEEPVVVFIAGQFKKFPMGGFKQHDNVDAETALTVTYIRLVIGGSDIVEIDVLANIWKVGGADILANYRDNIGG